MLRATAYWINRFLWTTLVSVLVLAAVYVSLGRYYATHIEQYKNDLMEYIVSYTGLPLTATHLYGDWSKLSPIITMENVALHSPNQGDQPVLTIKKIRIQVDSFGSLISRSLLVKQMSFSGVYSELEETKARKWQLKGYPTNDSESKTDFDKIIDLILSVNAVELSETALKLDYLEAPTGLLEVPELSLLHKNEFRRLRLQATFNKAANPLLAVIEASGDPRDIDGFSASGYLKLDDVDFTEQLPLIQSFGLNLHDAKVDGEVWVDWKPRGIISMQGVVAIPHLDWAAVVDSAQRLNSSRIEQEKPPLKDIKLNFRAEKSADNDWQLWLPAFQAQWSDQKLVFERLYVGLSTDSIDIAAPVISLDKLTLQMSKLQLLDEKGRSKLQTLSPRGNLKNVHLRIALKEGRAPFSLMSNLDGVAIDTLNGTPGAKGVDGYIEVTPTYGLVKFTSQQLSLSFPALYHHWLNFSRASGQIRWDVGDNRLLVRSGPMYLEADHGPATGQLSLDLPLKGDKGAPLMNLAIGLRDTPAHHRSKFLPYTLDQKFLVWMAKSVPEGQVIDAAFVFRGSLLAQEKDDRTVQLYFNIEDTTLDYHPRWPKLHDVSGLVMIDNAIVEATTQKAKMYGLDVDPAYMKIAPLQTGGAWLSINATAVGDGNDALKVVTQSAIHDIVGSVFDNWKLRGNVETDVQLGIPLAGAKDKAKVNIDVSLKNNKLQIPKFRLNFNKVTGPIKFSSNNGLVSSGIDARLYDKPVNVAIKSENDKSVLIDINGRVDMADVATWSKQPAVTFASGETDFNAKMRIKGKGQGEGSFSVNSDLLGVDIDLPVPFNKSKKTTHSFWLNLPIGNDKPMLSMGIEELAEFQLQLDDGNFKSALVIIDTDKKAIHSGSSIEHKEGVFTVTGNGPPVILSEWQDVFKRYLDAIPDSEPTSQKPSKPVAIEVKNLSLAGIEAFGQNFDRTALTAKRRGEAWWLTVSSKLLSGELLIPDDKNIPYSVDLQRLHFAERDNDKNLTSVDPTSFANIDIRIADVAFGNEHYGNIAFNLRCDAEGARFENLTGNIRGVHIKEKNPGLLTWSKVDGVDRSHLKVRLDMGDLSKVLDNWHYERIIKSEQAVFDVDLHWGARPNQWQLKISEGNIDVSVKKGRFLAASDTASGTLKVVGIINLANIARRLKLDFTDLYKKGISFDKISGQLQLADAQLVMADDLDIKSPSSAFKLRGKADLERELLDMDMIITLPVANNLPWIAALAGGLPTAAGVYVVGKIFEDQFDRLSSAIYTVEGDWNNPELKFKRVFDQKKKSKSKRENKKDKKDKVKSNSLDSVPGVKGFSSELEPAQLESSSEKVAQ